MNIIKKILLSLILSFVAISSSFAMESTNSPIVLKHQINWCYANSIFQVLVIIPGLRDFIAQYTSPYNPVANSLVEFLDEYHNTDPRTYNISFNRDIQTKLEIKKVALMEAIFNSPTATTSTLYIGQTGNPFKGMQDPVNFLSVLLKEATHETSINFSTKNILKKLGIKFIEKVKVGDHYYLPTGQKLIHEDGNFANILYAGAHYFVEVERGDTWFHVDDLSEKRGIKNTPLIINNKWTLRRLSFYTIQEEDPQKTEIEIIQNLIEEYNFFWRNNNRIPKIQKEDYIINGSIIRIDPETNPTIQYLVRYAVENNYTKEAAILLNHGAKYSYLHDKRQEQLILSAVVNNDFEKVKIYLESGANPNSQDNIQNPILFHAINKNNIEMVQLLINFGVELEARDMFGRTTLECAKSDEMRNILTSINYSIDDQLLIAINDRSIQEIRNSINQGASPNAKYNDGQTALHYAISKNLFEIASILIESRANIENLDNDSISDLLVNATEQAREILQQELLERHEQKRFEQQRKIQEAKERQREEKRTNIIAALKEFVFRSVLKISQTTNTYLEEDVLSEMLTRYNPRSPGFLAAKKIIRSEYNRKTFLRKMRRFISSNLLKELTNLTDSKLEQARDNIYDLYEYLKKNHSDLVSSRKRRRR